MKKSKVFYAVVFVLSVPVVLLLLGSIIWPFEQLSNIFIYTGKMYLVPVALILLADSFFRTRFGKAAHMILSSVTVVLGVASVAVASLFSTSSKNNFNTIVTRCVWVLFWSVLLLIIKELSDAFTERKSRPALIAFIVLSVFVLAANSALGNGKMSFLTNNVTTDGVSAVIMIASGFAVMILSALVGRLIGKTQKMWLFTVWLPLVIVSEFFAFSSGSSPWKIDLSVILFLTAAVVLIFIPCPIASFIERNKSSKWYESAYGRRNEENDISNIDKS